MSKAVFKVRGVSESPTRISVSARQFKLIVDEPQNLGGEDRGATPVEYLLASLAGCLNVVGFLVAEEMGFGIRNLEIELGGSLDPSKFMGKSDEPRAGYDGIDVSMKLDTDADEDTIKKWLEIIEERFPVSDNLANTTPLSIRYEQL